MLRLGERLGLLAVGLVLALVAAEILLRIGAVFVGTSGDAGRRWTGQARRILCLGDSNTYGLYLDREDAYPNVLERLWNGQAGFAEIEVLNLGVPGMNSSKLRNTFAAVAASYRPDVTLLLIGANNTWTVPAPPEDAAALTWQQRLWNRSRVFRLLYMVDRAARGDGAATDVEVSVAAAGGREPASGTVRFGERALDISGTRGIDYLYRDWTRGLADDLARMREAASANGTELVLLTYAWDRDSYRVPNQVIRAANGDASPVVDLAAAFDAVCRDRRCPELFFPDGHPTRLGHQLVAATLWSELQRLHGRPAAVRDEARWADTLDAEVRGRLDGVRASASREAPVEGAKGAR